MPIGDKSKKCHGVDCPRHAFAFAPDELDTATWLLPVWIPGDAQKSLNAVKTSLHRFDTAKVPDSERERVWFTLYGAALALGIPAERRTFAANIPASAPAPAAEPVAKQTWEPERLTPSTQEIREQEALADIRADEFLAALGLE
jgi:hypothetical protein